MFSSLVIMMEEDPQYLEPPDPVNLVPTPENSCEEKEGQAASSGLPIYPASEVLYERVVPHPQLQSLQWNQILVYH